MASIRPGLLLLAEPFLLDPNFKRAAIAVVDHRPEGTVGFVLNALTSARVEDLLADFPAFDGNVYIGGPVQQDTLHYVHTLGNLLGDAQEIREELWWGGDFEELTQLVATGIADSTNVRFFLGYTGWSEGQLEEECREGTWVFADLTSDLVFGTPPDRIWPKAMQRLGNTYAIIGEMEDEPLN